MKKTATLLLLTIMVNFIYAQNVSDGQTINTSVSETINASPGFNFLTDAEKMIAEMMQLVGLKPNFTVKAGRVQNAAASIRHGRRLILYNPDFISEMNKKGISTWTYIFILAHEVGHHLNGHTVLKGKKEVPAELEADEFAGFILYKLGATLLQARSAVKHISNPASTNTHPGSADRIEAMEKGWSRASRQ
jgi:hypothetical protein